MPAFPERLVSLQPFWNVWYLDKQLGEGSFGRVYRIYREEFGDRYLSAMKWIPLPISQTEINSMRNEGYDDGKIRAFYDDQVLAMRSEVKLMNSLRGTSHIVSFEDHAFIPRRNELGWDILIRMELLQTLSEKLSEGMTVGDVVQMGIDLCDALSLCAKHKIIHRDIKPDNIFISPNGDYKLGDFGVARQITHDYTNMSQKGTPVYMAPEVYLGKEGDTSVDQYSLGLVMHRLLNAQQLPFAPAFDRILTHSEREAAFDLRIKGTPVPPPLQGSDRLKTIVCRACSYQARKRYPSLDAMRSELMEVLQDKRTCAMPLIVAGKGPSTPSGRSTLIGNPKPPKIKRLIPIVVSASAGGLAVFLMLKGGLQEKHDSPSLSAGTSVVSVEPSLPVTAEPPTPMPTASPSPSPTASPSPTPTASPSPTPTASPSPTPTASPSPSPTASPSPSPTASPSPSPTASPSPSPTASPSPTPTASPTPEPAETPTPAPSMIPVQEEPQVLPAGDVYHYGYSTSEQVNVRQKPDRKSASLAKLAQGTVFWVIECTEGGDGYAWCRIRADGVEGYMMAQYVQLMSAAEEARYIATLDSLETPSPTPTASPSPTATQTAISNMYYTFTPKIEDGQISIDAENLTIRVQGDGQVEITIDGLTLADSYMTNMATTPKNYQEYGWSIEMFDSVGHYEVETSFFARNPGANEKKRLSDMDHSFSIFENNYTRPLKEIAMRHTDHSITWTFSLPVNLFDFANAQRFVVEIRDPSIGIEYHSRSYKQNTTANASPATAGSFASSASSSEKVESIAHAPMLVQSLSERFTASEISAVTFMDDLSQAPSSAIDVSASQDRSILAWQADGQELLIASSGKIRLNPDSSGLFRGFYNAQHIRFNGCVDTSAVMDMHQMFAGCEALEELDVSDFDTSNVTDMSFMFDGCKALKTLDLSGFNTSNVIDIGCMFQSCAGLTDLDVSCFNTAKVAEMGFLFSGCEQLRRLDLSSFDTSLVTNASCMFQGCNHVVRITAGPSFMAGDGIDKTDMFAHCSVKEVRTDRSVAWPTLRSDSQQSPDDTAVFGNSNIRRYQIQTIRFSNDISNASDSAWDVSVAKDGSILAWVKKDNNGLFSLTIAGKGGINLPEDSSSLFAGYTNLTSIRFENVVRTRNAKNMRGMFSGCLSLSRLDLSGFDTRNVTNMSCMFEGCNQVSAITLDSFDTAKVTDMSNMFKSCFELKTLNLQAFDTSNVRNMNGLFESCINLTSIDASGFDLSRVTDLSRAFFLCGALTSLKVPEDMTIGAAVDKQHMLTGSSDYVSQFMETLIQ